MISGEMIGGEKFGGEKIGGEKIGGEKIGAVRHGSGAGGVRAGLLGRTAMSGALAMVIAFGTPLPRAKADPQGTVVISGDITIQKSGTHTEFTQGSNTAILNHNSFDINVNESVRFQQPSAGSLAVNRVVGSDVSTTIAGQLTANGNVWVMNPSGVAISNSARINVNGLLATSARISDADILSGNHSFAGAAAGSAVTNAGDITAGDGGVVLVAPVVDNSGTITTSGGDIALGAGSGFTVDFSGDGLTRFAVEEGEGVSLTNSGTISAEGAAVYISAASAGAVQGSIVSIGGRVEATRVEDRGGQIVISGGQRGTVEITGTIDASQGAGDGGTAILTGETVVLTPTAVVDVSGAANGGVAEIGAGRRGTAFASDVVQVAARASAESAPVSAPIPRAKTVTLEAGATVTANAGGHGDGGEIIFFGEEIMTFDGFASAKGGQLSGDGGFLELSGLAGLSVGGTFDLVSPAGQSGALLLDPVDVLIDGGGDTDGPTIVAALELGIDVTVDTTATDSGPDPSIIGGSGPDTTVGGNITLSDDILVGAIDSGTMVPDTEATLTFNAERNINLNNPITRTSTGTLTVVLNADTDAQLLGADTEQGTINFNNAAANIIADSVTLSGAETLTLRGITAGTLTATSTLGSIVDTAAADIVVSGTGTFNAAAGNVTLANVNHNIGTLSGTTTAMSLSQNAAVTLGTINATTLAVTSNTAGISDTTGQVITLGGLSTFTAAAGNDIVLNQATHDLGSIGLTGRNASITNTDALRLRGVNLTGDLTASAGTSLIDDTAVNTVAGLTNLSAGSVNLDLENDFGSFSATTSQAAGVTVNDANAIILNTISAAQLNVTTTTLGVTQTNASGTDGISITGATAITVAAGSDIILNDVDNDFDSNDDLVGAIAASGRDVTISAADTVLLGDIDATRNLSVSAGQNATLTGSILDDGGSSLTGDINVGNFTSLVADNSIVLNDAFNDFIGPDTSTLSANAGTNDITIYDVSTLGIGTITGGNVTLRTGDYIGITNGISANAGAGTVTLENNSTVTGYLGGAAVASNWHVTDVDLGTLYAASVVANSINNDAIVIQGITALTEALTVNAGTGSVSVTGSNTLTGGLTASGSTFDMSGNTTLVGGASTLSVTAAGTSNFRNANVNTLFVDAGDDVTFDGTGTGNTFSTSITVNDTNNANLTLFQTPSGGVVDIALTNGGTVTTGTLNLTSGTGSISIGTGDLVSGTSVVSTLAPTTGGAITIGGLTANTVTASSATSIDAASTSNDFNRFNATVTGGGAIDLVDSDAIELGTINASGNLTVTAGGLISDAAGTAITSTSTGATANAFTATGTNNIQLNNPAAHSFAGGVSLSANQINNFVTTNDLTLSGISATDTTNVTNAVESGGALAVTGALTTATLSDLRLTTNGAITQSAGIVTTDTLTLITNANNATLTQSNAVGTLAVTGGGDIALTDTGALVLGNVTSTGLTLGVDTTITQATGTSVGVTNTTALTSGGDITLNNSVLAVPSNDFGTLTATTTADTVTISDLDDLVVGSISAAALNIDARGAIAQVGGSSVSVTGTANVAATGTPANITLDQSGNNFGTVVATAAGDTVTIVDQDALVLGSTLTSNLNVTVTTGTITQSGAITADGTTTLQANGTGGISLPTSTNNFGTVAATAAGDTIYVRDSNALTLAASTGSTVTARTVAGALTVSGNVSGTNGVNLYAEGGLALNANVTSSAGAINLFSDTDNDGGNITIGTTVSVTAGGNLNFYSGAGYLADTGTGTFTVSAGGGLQFPSISFANTSLVARAYGGAVTQETNSSISIARGTSIVAQNVAGTTQYAITLNAPGVGGSNDFADVMSAYDVDLTGSTITITDSDTIALGTIAGSALSVAAGGSVTQSSGSTITVPGNTVISATNSPITLANTGNNFANTGTAYSVTLTGGTTSTATGALTISDTDSLRLGNLTGYSLSVTAGDVDLSGTVNINAATTALFTNASGGRVTVGNEVANEFSLGSTDIAAIVASTQSVQITSANQAVEVEGLTSVAVLDIIAGTGSVDFNTTASSFTTLTVTSAGSIGQNAGVTVTGATSLTATYASSLVTGVINMDVASDFQGAVNVSGTNVTLTDSNDLTLTSAVAAAGGTAAGNLVVTTGGDATLASISAAGSLSVNAGDSIDDTIGQTIAVGGATTLLAGASGDFDDIALEQAGHDFTGAVSATGEDITLNDVNAIILGAISTNEAAQTTDADPDSTADTLIGTNLGDLVVTAGGSITDNAAATGVQVEGTTSLLANSGASIILLDNAANDFDQDVDGTGGDALNRVDASGSAVTLTDASSIALGAITSTSTLSVTAVGSIVDTGGATISVTGTTALDATDTVGGNFDILLDNDGTTFLHNFGGAVSADAEQILIRQNGTMTVGTMTAAGGTNDATIADQSLIYLTEAARTAELLEIANANVDLQNVSLVGASSITASSVLVSSTAAETVDDTFVDSVNATILSVRSTGNISLTGVSDTTTGTIVLNTSSATAGTVGGSASLYGNILVSGANSVSNNLRLIAGGNITQSGGSLTVPGTTLALAANSVAATATTDTLQSISLTATSNNFTGTVDALASGSIALFDANAIDLGIVSAGYGENLVADTGRNLQVTAFSGAISQQAITAQSGGGTTTGGRAIFVRGDSDGAGTLNTDLVGSRVEVADETTLFSGSTITLNQGQTDTNAGLVSNDFDRLSNAASAGDAVDFVTVSGTTVSVLDQSAIALGQVIADTLTVGAAGSITDTAALAITVTGETTVTATSTGGDFFDIVLDEAALHNFDSDAGATSDATQAFNATGEAIIVTDVDAIMLGAITATTDTVATGIDPTNAGNGTLTVTAGGSITDGAATAIVVGGTTSLDATTGFDILLDNDGTTFINSFGGAVTANGEQIRVRQTGTLTVGSMTASGGTNDATISPGAVLYLTTNPGGEQLAATSFDLDLLNANVSGSTLNAPIIGIASSTGDITVDATFASGGLTATNLTVQALGTYNIAIDAANLTVNNVTGVTTAPTVAFVTSNIADDATGSTPGGNVTIGANGLSVYTSASVNTNLRIVSGGNITATGPVSVTGTTFLRAADSVVATAVTDTLQNISLSNVNNSFGSTIDALASGSILLYGQSIDLGFVSAGFRETLNGDTGRDLTVNASVALTQQPNTGRSIFPDGDDNGIVDAGDILLTPRIEVADSTSLGSVSFNFSNPDNDFDRLITGGGNVATNPVTATGTLVIINEANSVALGNITATSGLSVTAGGSIIDAPGTTITVTGNTTLSATDGTNFFDILLDNQTDFGGSNVSATGGDITIETTTGALNITDITANANADSTITTGVNSPIGTVSNVGNVALGGATTLYQFSSGTITAPGTTRLSAGTGGIYAAPTAGNAFTGTVDLYSAGSATVSDADSIILGDVDVRGNLTVRALAGTITDSGTAGASTGGVRVQGSTSLSATGAITLDDLANDFDSDTTAAFATDAVDVFAGGALYLADISAIALGTVTAPSLSIRSGGAITDTFGGTIAITGNTTLTAQRGGNFDIQLDNNATHDFDGVVTAAGGDIHINDADSLQLGSITAAANTDATITLDGDSPNSSVSNAGNLRLIASGAITQTAAFDVAGTTDIEAPGFAVTLTQANLFSGAVEISANDATVVDNDSIILGDVEIFGNLTVTASNGSITDDGLGNAAFSDIDVFGDVSLSASNAVQLDDPGNDFRGTVNVSAGTGATVVDVGALTLGTLTASSMSLTAGGTVTDSTGGSITVSGASTIDAGTADVLLVNGTNDFSGGEALQVTGANVFIAETNGFDLGPIVATGNVDIDTTNRLDLTGTSTITGAASFDSASGADSRIYQGGSLSVGGDATFAARLLTALQGDVTVGGGLTVTTGADNAAGDTGFILSGTTDVTGDVSVTSTGAATMSGTLSAGGTGLFDINGAFTGGTTTIGGPLSVTANGPIAHSGVLSVRGSTTLTATGQDVTAAEANILDGAVTIDGANVTLGEGSSDGLLINAITATGSLSIDASGGSVTDVAGNAAGGGITVAGTTSITAGNSIDLNDLSSSFSGETTLSAPNDVLARLGTFGDTVNCSATRCLITSETADISLGAISASQLVASANADGASIVVQAPLTGLANVGLVAGSGGNIDFSGLSGGEIINSSGYIALVTVSGAIIMPQAGDGTMLSTSIVSASALSGTFAEATGFSDGVLTAAGLGGDELARLLATNSSIELSFGQDLVMTAPISIGADDILMQFDAGGGSVALKPIGSTDIVIGDAAFQVARLQPNFDPLGDNGDINNNVTLLSVNGSLRYEPLTGGADVRFDTQNTASLSLGANDGVSSIIGGPLIINNTAGADIEQLTLFGSIDGLDSTNAAFQVTLENFDPNDSHTVNGCTIGSVSSCTPLGSLQLFLNFETGQFLRITLLDPEEEEDDPFTNRGDEEVWE
ncbi:MAG: filamentous hemagglutinin N-terminal domain-containing protein [Pseudomonadota bacterium]